MLNEVNTRIKLTRIKDAFCLMATGDQVYKAQITSVALVIRKVKISPSVYLAHAKALENGMAKYPIHRVICKTFTVYPPAIWMSATKNYSPVGFPHD
jgi:hypothetical protein